MSVKHPHSREKKKKLRQSKTNWTTLGIGSLLPMEVVQIYVREYPIIIIATILGIIFVARNVKSNIKGI